MLLGYAIIYLIIPHLPYGVIGMREKSIKGPELAGELFNANYNCAQSTLAGILSAKGMSYEDRIRLAGAFGAGIAQTGGMCGALTGALMAFGLLIRPGEDIAAWKAEVAGVSREHIRNFECRYGDTSCSALAGCDMSDASSRQSFHDDGGRERVCAPMVKGSVEMALGLLKGRR